jgi:hypothetical protein
MATLREFALGNDMGIEFMASGFQSGVLVSTIQSYF